MTPEQIICAPSLPGSPPLTPSPKRRSNSPRDSSISTSPRPIPSGQSVVVRPFNQLLELNMKIPPDPTLAVFSNPLLGKNFELPLRLPNVPANKDLSPEINITTNPSTQTSAASIPAVPPQIFVKQGVSKCKECNIVFCKYENYLAHKKHYCSSRNLEEIERSDTNSPVSPQPTPPSTGAQYQQLICAACGIKFTSLDNLNAHQMYYCPKRTEITIATAKEARCTKCKTIHEPGQPCAYNSQNIHKCPICENISSTSAELKKHMETHSGIKAFRCSICRYKGNTLR